jgi:hypothetical protein
MTDQRTPNQKLAQAIGFGLEARAKLDALVDVLKAKGVIGEKDVREIEARSIEIARAYEKDMQRD